jgi:saccharopine dehydrogenase-like NADP-dependent oxidoreductase
MLKKARGALVDAHDKDSIINAARGVDLILNALPLECTKNVLEAALAVQANYQDYAATTALHDDWVESIRIQYDVYGPKFAAIGKLALVGTGSAPGLICVATRDAMRIGSLRLFTICLGRVEAKLFSVLVV